jgi:hypothetical protein
MSPIECPVQFGIMACWECQNEILRRFGSFKRKKEDTEILFQCLNNQINVQSGLRRARGALRFSSYSALR